MQIATSNSGLLPLGVHFGLDDEIYHADPGLGSTDIRRLLQSPADFWHHSKWNPDRPVSDTDAKTWGRAFHKLTLEGPEAFARAYVMEPDKSAEAPGLIVTLDDMKADGTAGKISTTWFGKDIVKK